MKVYSTEFYHAAIKNAFPDACDIRTPYVMGMVAPVFLADINEQTRVFKFNRAPVIFKNKVVSDLMRDYDIAVPYTTVHAYVNTWFESYEYCSQKTLFEHMQNGLSAKYVLNAYANAIKIQAKISAINPVEFQPKQFRHHYEMMGLFLAPAPFPFGTYREFWRSRAKINPMRLTHNDIHPKNILYTPETGQTRLIDLDAISLCNEDYMLLTMLQQYPLNNVNDLLDIYEQTVGHSVRRTTILVGWQIMRTMHHVGNFCRKIGVLAR